MPATTTRGRLVERLPPRWVGTMEYVLRRRLRRSWGGPLNGQHFRQQIFQALLSVFPFKAIVETGTYRGTTTNFFAQESGLPVYSVEVHPRYYAFARLSLRQHPNVRLQRGNSPDFLNTLTRDEGVPKSDVFFYLDAHWGDYLPLADEIAVILDHWTRSVIMIDDFQVPGDDGYGYGICAGEPLCLDYLAPLSRFGWVAFPKVPSSDETGACRGCVVVSGPDVGPDELAGVDSLRPYEAP